MKRKLIFLILSIFLLSTTAVYAYWTNVLDIKMETPVIYNVNINFVENIEPENNYVPDSFNNTEFISPDTNFEENQE